MNIIEQRRQFEASRHIYESAKLTFKGVEGFDVYNTSIPFEWNGRNYIFGRVEKRTDWARSWVRLFEYAGNDTWALVPNSMIYQLEDPYIAKIDNTIVLGGTHVRYKQGKIDTFYGYFYKGSDLNDLYYFTTGPDYMKDIRLVKVGNKGIGVFSRPRNEEVRKKYGSGSVVGFTIINSLNDLNEDVILNAPVIDGLFGKDEWGGCNQCYYLDSGLIGVIGHRSYISIDSNGGKIATYMNIAFIFDPAVHKVKDIKIIGTRPCYPDGPAKKPELVDCCFTSGIVMREDGKAELYSGIGDTEEGRIVIDYPFEGYGKII